MKKLLSLMLCLTLAVSMFSLEVYATETPDENCCEIKIDMTVLQDMPDDNRLFNAYVDRQFFGSAVTFGTAAKDFLNDVEQAFYTPLKEHIISLAANGGSTEIILSPSDITGLVYSWPAGTDVVAELENQADMNKVWSALVHDCPYDLYWIDKNRSGLSMGITTADDGTNVSVSQFEFSFPVSVNWRRNPSYATTITTNVSKVKLAVENAVLIADKYSVKDDYTKLLGFKNEICNLTDYDRNEVTDGADYVDNSAWQIINVFDEDPATKVVWEGYAKAFQYLCDLSEFDDAKCYTVSGALDGTAHMWNLVTMADGYTYLVDVTNSDDGMTGQYGQFFMAGYDDGGRWSGFVVNGRRYSYISGIIFDINTLTLAPSDYLYIPQDTVHHGQCGDNAHWFLNESGTLTITGWGDMWNEYQTSGTTSQLPPWHEYAKDIKAISVQEGITSISNYRFYMCQHAITANIPSTVTSVDEMAFYSCMALKELTVPDSVTYLGKGAFGNCSSMEKITLSKNIDSIPDWLLNSAAITEIVIPDGVTAIGEYAFYLCNNLAKVTMPVSVSSVGQQAFYSYPGNTVTDVYYAGSENEWNNISVGVYNENLTGSNIHFAVLPQEELVRIKGKNRYETSLVIADAVKRKMGVEKFDAVIIASGEKFADALAGSYLAEVKNAPVLMAGNNTENSNLTEYIKQNLKEDGMIYILGGTAAVPRTMENLISGFNIKRIYGTTRYETNIAILKEAGVTSQDILVASGTNFADSLSASAVAKPILLVDGSGVLSSAQEEYIESLQTDNFYILGGTAAVNADYETVFAKYGTVERVKGTTRYETSVAIAEKFFAYPEGAVITYAENFPDGLCGGPLALSANSPLILTRTGKREAAKSYMQSNNIKYGAVLGGDILIDDDTAKNIFDVDNIIIWK